jgi:putative sulfotransferase
MPLTELTGAQYWSLMSEPSELGSLMTRLGVVPSEYRYPAGGRFAGDQSTIPPILYVTLPGISADPDLLFGVLAEKVPQFPAQRVGLHHKMLLNLMASLTGKRRWIERSGASSALAQPLLEAFGEAKIVYLTRNIEDTAKSMSRHASFQFAAVRHEFHLRYGTDPYARWARKDLLPDPEDMPEEVRRLLPDRLTAETLREMSQDPARYEAMCAHMMGSAEQALADMKPRHLHRIRYEDLLADPRDELTRLGEFLGFADPSGWAEGIADRVKSPRASSVRPA